MGVVGGSEEHEGIMTAFHYLRHLGLAVLCGLLGLAASTAWASAAEEAGPSPALFASPFYTCVNNFYVATNGSDSNPGTQARPWLTIQHADSSSRAGGDCINVAPGTYQANVLLKHGGSGPTQSGYVVYRCETLDGCHILAPGGGHLWGIEQPANFIVVDGFELDGNNALQTDGAADDCIASDGDTYGTGNSSHHIWVLNSIAHHCGLGGIGFNNKEWYYIIHNTVYHNAWSSGFQGSGIGLVVVQCIEAGNASCASGSTYAGGTGTYTPSGMDTASFNPAAGDYAPFHNIVAWNNVYDNEIAPNNPVGCGAHTDGNGIIMDTFLDETTATIVFPFQTLVLGNVSYENGGRGVHIFRTSNTTVANNTAYANGTDTCSNSFGLADLSQAGGSNNLWINNVAQSVVTASNPGCSGQVSGTTLCGANNVPLIAGSSAGITDTNNTFVNNITYGGVGAGELTTGSTGLGLYGNDIAAYSTTNNKTNTNPMLVNPANNNFALQAGSPAIAYAQSESFLPASAADAGGCSSSLTSCPGIVPAVASVSPTSGSTAGGTAVTITGAGFTGATAVTFGSAATTGLTVVSDSQITVTAPAGTAGTVDITVTVPGGTSPTTTADNFTYASGLLPPVAGAGSATVGYDSTANAVTLSLSGGTATSVAIASAAAHGTATATGTSIKYSPTTGFFGSDSFTYTASNTAGTSSAATISVTVSAPTISVTPTTLAGGVVGTAYSQSLSASGGQSPYSFSTTVASGALPGGLALASNGTISGTPTASGTFTFTVHGTDSSTASHASFTSGTISLTVSPAAIAPVVAGPVSATVGYDSTANAITLNLSGGAASSVAIGSAAAHGTATATGTSIKYTPTTGFFGSDSFTYTASNTAGTSSPATISVTVSAPAISVTPTTLTGGAVGTVYSQSLSASGGQAPYSFSSTVTSGALPGGLSLASNGTISGTPTASGTFTFTVQGTDSSTATHASFTSATISLAISPASTPVVSSVSPNTGSTAGGKSVTITGANLTGATAVKFGTAAATGVTVVNAGQITATTPAGSAGTVDVTVTTSHGTSTTSSADHYSFVTPAVAGAASASVAYNSLNNAVALNLSGGTATSVAIASAAGHGTAVASGISIFYTPATGFFGTDSFTYTATNAAGTSAAATVSIRVSAPIIAVNPTTLAAGTVGTSYSQSLSASGGQAPYSFSTTVASGALPGGLALSSNGTISGTPNSAGSFTFTVRGTDSSTLTAASFNSTVISVTIAAAGVPTVSSVSPSSGPTLGGNLVTITGTNLNGATAVSFAGVSATGIVPLSPTQVVATVPARSAAGIVDVTVTTPHGTSATSGLDHYSYVAPDSIAGQVYNYESTLGTTGVPGNDNAHFSQPVVGAVDPVNGHLFVADSANHRIQILDTGSLTVVGTLGVAGVAGGDNAHLNGPVGVGVDTTAGHIFVADTGNQRIQIYDAKSFTYLATMGVTGVTGADNGHFNQPVNVRMNQAASQLYVADAGNHRIQIFASSNAAYLATIGTSGVPGSDNAHLNGPRDAELNITTNQIMVADTGNSRIQLFNAQGLAYDQTIGGTSLSPGDNLYFGSPVAAAFDATTNLVLVTDAGTDDRVEVLDALSYNYVLTLGTFQSAGPANTQFSVPMGAAVDPTHARLFIGDAQNDRVQVYSIEGAVEVASVLPGSRSVQLDTTATIFASIINAGATPLNGCQVSLPVTAPAGLTMSYQTTDPATNAPTGSPNTPATVAGNNGVQSFLLAFQGTSAFSTAGMMLDFDCSGVAPAPITVGVDTVDLAMSTAPVPDVIALAATATNNGIVVVPTGGTGAFALASANVGVGATINVSVNTGAASLPVAATICQTVPATGQCLATPASSIAANIAAAGTPTFAIFLKASAPIPLEPATSRIFVNFTDAGGALHGSTSVAIETQ